MVTEFKTEKYNDFSLQENISRMEAAFAKIEKDFGREYPLHFASKTVFTEKKFPSVNPSEKDQVIGMFSMADVAMAEKAINAAYEEFQTWQFTIPEARSRILLRAASIMKQKRFELDALMVLEAGKNWLEADADVAEAIDFLEFYAREMMRLAERQPMTRLEGEDNELYYMPLGVGIVLPPWNFPLAILAGMTSAAIVAGNTVILKPASPTPAIAYKFYEIMMEAGLPEGVLSFFTGSGGTIGDYLVSHPKTRFISFTGSKEVGLRINELAAKTGRGQKWIKRVTAEMGGKDTIVVDEDADLESAAQGIFASAFGFQGQKCSACSRAVIHESAYEKIVEMVVEKTRKIIIGPVRNRKNWLGPVINESAEKAILDYIGIGSKEGNLLCGGEKAEGNGYFIKPTIFGDVDQNARIAQEEIFGPVLAFIRAKDFDDAIEIANNTEYGLTGAVYSRDRDHLEKARSEFFVGNLYLNRKCTGALVGVHPFGGFNMSGTDSKAGGRDYLLLLTQAKCVSELL
jgi:1-pyrroline-5-carboxylate dehydrogenase